MADTVRVLWKRLDGRDALVCYFPEHLTTAAAADAAGRIESLLANNRHGAVPFVWECSRMQNYDAEARAGWQRLLQDNREQIGTIHLVTTSALIKIGATALSMFTGITVKTWRSLADVVLD